MSLTFEAEHYTDENGAPAGGFFRATGVSIAWQNGPLGRGDERRAPNGAFVETVIEAARDRLEYYQDSRFACEANALAIAHLEEALEHLHARTAERESRGVEGTHEE